MLKHAQSSLEDEERGIVRWLRGSSSWSIAFDSCSGVIGALNGTDELRAFMLAGRVIQGSSRSLNKARVKTSGGRLDSRSSDRISGKIPDSRRVCTKALSFDSCSLFTLPSTILFGNNIINGAQWTHGSS